MVKRKKYAGPDMSEERLGELKALVEGIRQIEEAVGTGRTRSLSQGEVMNRANLAKSLIVNRDLKAGTAIEEGMVEIKSPGRGLQPNRRPHRMQAVPRVHKGSAMLERRSRFVPSSPS